MESIVLDFDHPNGKSYSKVVKVEKHYQAHEGFVEFSHYSVIAHTQHWSVEAQGEDLDGALSILADKLKESSNP